MAGTISNVGAGMMVQAGSVGAVESLAAIRADVEQLSSLLSAVTRGMGTGASALGTVSGQGASCCGSDAASGVALALGGGGAATTATGGAVFDPSAVDRGHQHQSTQAEPRRGGAQESSATGSAAGTTPGSPEATVVEYLKSIGSIEEALAAGKIEPDHDGDDHYSIGGPRPKLPGSEVGLVVDNGDGTISAQVNETTGNGMPSWWKGESNRGNEGGNAGANGDHGHINEDGTYRPAHG